MSWLLSLLGPDSILWALGAAAVGAAVMWIRSSAKKEVRAEINTARIEAIKDKKEKDDEVDSLAPADVDARFNRWVRHDSKG